MSTRMALAFRVESRDGLTQTFEVLLLSCTNAMIQHLKVSAHLTDVIDVIVKMF
jgi:hypothetical protein